jgi:hypothetical protein
MRERDVATAKGEVALTARALRTGAKLAALAWRLGTGAGDDRSSLRLGG